MTRAADGGPTADLAGRRRLRLRCRGAVQGVGFRPTVHRLATSLDLGGWVANDPDGATVEVEGTAASVERFVALLPGRLPALARTRPADVEAIAGSVRTSPHPYPSPEIGRGVFIYTIRTIQLRLTL